MPQAPPLLNPFVGREREQELYRQFLTWTTPWMMVITGQGGIGKSTLLHHLVEQTPPGIAILTLNFAILSLRTDPLAILEELVEQIRPDCDPGRMQAFELVLQEGRARLEALGTQVREIKQEVHVSDQSSAQGLHLNISLMQEQRREVRKQVASAFYASLLSLSLTHLVLLLDTCEWLSEPEGQEVGQWVLDELLVGVHARLRQRRKACSVILASRMKLSLSTIERHEQYPLTLGMLERSAVENYLIQIGMQDAALRERIYAITQGHALCVSIIGFLWQKRGNQPFTLADLPELQEQFSEHALLEFIQERLEQRLSPPFRELTRYGVLLRTFNLLLLQAVFPDFLPEKGALEYFQQLIRYPYIESRGDGQYAFHDLVRKLQAPHIREQEPEQWRRCHQHALNYLTRQVPESPDWYYHAIASAEKQGISTWEDAVQEAQLHGQRDRLRALLQVAYDEALKLTDASCAIRMYQMGRYYYYGSDMSAALASYEEALKLYRQVGARLGEANVRKAIGDVQQFRKELEAALASYEEALKLYRQVGDRLGEANCYLAQGRVGLAQGDYQKALRFYIDAYQLYQQIQDRYSQARLLYYRSFVYEAMNEPVLAIQDIETALVIAQRIDLPFLDLFQQRLGELQQGSS